MSILCVQKMFEIKQMFVFRGLFSVGGLPLFTAAQLTSAARQQKTSLAPRRKTIY
jgi:hypothetical protein